MSRKTLHTADGEGFLRAYTDLLGEMKRDYGFEATLRVDTTDRRGVLRFRISCWLPGKVGEGFPAAAVVLDYPTAQNATLEGFLYRLALKLDGVVEQQLKWPMGKA